MASNTSHLQLDIKHGSKKFKVELSIPETDVGEVLTVQRLQDKLYELTGIPVDGQKLIHKGKSLMDPDMALHKLGLKNGATVMLLGSKPIPQDQLDMSKVHEIESRLSKEEKNLSEVIHQLDGIHRGFVVDEDMKAKQLNQLRKKLLSFREHFLRILETLDSLRFDEHNELGRRKKKDLSQKLEKLSIRVDDLLSGVDDIRVRFGY